MRCHLWVNSYLLNNSNNSLFICYFKYVPNLSNHSALTFDTRTRIRILPVQKAPLAYITAVAAICEFCDSQRTVNEGDTTDSKDMVLVVLDLVPKPPR